MAQNLSLRRLFYQSFDSSVVTQFVQRLTAVSEAERRGFDHFLGEGFHFQSFLLHNKTLPLAINLAKNSFLKQGEVSLSRWKNAIEVAKNLHGISLIPPMEILTSNNYLAIVMPKGQSLPRGDERQIDGLLCDAAKALGRVGLVLDDYPQLRQASGVPFIIDWSDLNFIPLRS